ncbi:2-octaprenyl-6-methoxyphenyl hydroxylase [Luteimonas kalidii]|uniref:2-octaprenyl-6-methoxyphenyl hydroxylase n=1 Tax=Luteimonas kalidii TaxID=3042025 RepID=A0ABT6JT58_9GAMM|nr:2-octaprenyl-6-methoxyphenyl hydroxylase [Luteimonas kalidii]MDH5833136.1 2-octaprenyl-6-methoxyphenyl hydroxylase [Luteimonas kalidii]
MEREHGILIVGGGLVGASLALALDRAGVPATLLEATSSALPPVFDQRNLSFAEATVNALSALGVMQRLRTPTGAIRRIHASRSGDFGRVLLDARDYGRNAFGQVVVARDFGQALDEALTAATQVRRLRARFVSLAESEPGMRRLCIDDGTGEHVVAARLVVAADGTGSGLRAALGIEAEHHDYGQRLFVARLRASQAPDGTAFERLGDHGPTALLPRGDGAWGLVHGVDADHADAVAGLPDAAFLQRVQDAFGWRAGRLLEVGERSVYPAVRTVARRTTAARAVLVGNAAQTLHPVGAQGFNLGLRDALTLAEVVAGADDPGAEALLAGYAARRHEDRTRTLAFSDALARLSASRVPLLRPLRSAGMVALDRVPSLQALLAGGAMGYRGDVPALCRAQRA